MTRTIAAVCLGFVCLSASPALAQNWSFDARAIGLGGVGSAGNVAVSMIDEQREYRSIVLPFGLIQVLQDFGKFNPTEDDFDLIRAVEYAASPIHYVVGRDTSDSGYLLVNDLRNGQLSRDLNRYRGFAPSSTIIAEGLASPSWGYTFKVKKSATGAFQGIYVGAGPYLAMREAASIDPNLISLLSSSSAVYTPNQSYVLDNEVVGQAALAITGGYRGRFAWGAGIGGGTEREGLYIGANYHFLRGFRYEDFNQNLRLDTDAAGLITLSPLVPRPLLIRRDASSNGLGLAMDVGVAGVVGPWEFGLSVNGIANRIDWNDVERTDYFLTNLLTGGDFLDTPEIPIGDVRVELPVDYRANGAYQAEMWTAIAEFSRGFQGTSFRAGYEQRLGRIQLRGGGRYIQERFEPSGGIGFNLTDRFGIDVAAFATSANVERSRHLALAVSLRLMR